MSKISEERKEELLRKYGSKPANTKGSAMMGPPDPGPMGGPKGGPHGRTALSVSKPQDTFAVIKRLFTYIGNDKIKIMFVFLCVLGGAISSLGGSYILRPIINGLVDSKTTFDHKVQNLMIGILIMAGIYIVGIICQFLQQRIMIDVSQNALVKIRAELFKKIQKLPVKYYDKHPHGEIMSHFTNDLDAVGEMLNNTLSQIFSAVITLVGTLILMFVTNWILAIVTVITVPMFIQAGKFLGQRSKKYYKSQQQSLGAVNGYIEESVTGQKVVKVFCHEDIVTEEFEYLSDELRKSQLRAQFFGGIMGPVIGNLSQISFAISATVGGILCLTGRFDIGGLTIFTNYSRQFSRPINELSQQVNTIFSAFAGAERVFRIMDEKPEVSDEADAMNICSTENHKQGARIVQGEVQLKNVTFGYDPNKMILKNISVTAKPGQKIAFVGSTGAGKTTITNLINRFYDIKVGEILIDGINIKKIKKDSLRENVAVVLQDTHLFSGTVKENIRYGRLDATEEEVIIAAKTASAHSFIERLEDGYDTVLDGDGSNLSQGQRQLLNIARASISKAPILILDEATSSVDTRTEKHIEHGMERLMKNRTTFVIAHRLSTVRNADLILVLEHGEIVEQGTHDELLKMRGRYFQLYTGAVELD